MISGTKTRSDVPDPGKNSIHLIQCIMIAVVSTVNIKFLLPALLLR